MTLDWPVIGAVAGVAASAVVVAIGAFVVLRPAEQAKPNPSGAILLASRPVSTPQRADLHTFSGSQAATTGLTSPSRDRPDTQYQLFPAEPVTTPLKADPPASSKSPLRRPPEPIVARPTVVPQREKPPAGQAASGAPQRLAALTPEQPMAPPKIVDRRYDGVLTVAHIAKLRANLQLTPEQVPHWGPVEAELRRIGRLQMAQVDAGHKPEVPTDAVQRLYQAASPLLMTMRPEQKERVRALARSLGYASVASMI